MSKKPLRAATRVSVFGRLRSQLLPFIGLPAAAVLLRLFLGGTMLYAGFDKLLLDERFLQADGVGSIGETLRTFVAAGGPLAPLVNALGVGSPVLIGTLMAGSQLLVGTLLVSGSWVRLGALLGAAISLSLALTASWGVSPYYYGNDLPYLVGFLALAALGDGGYLRAGAPSPRRYDPQRRAAILTGGGTLLALLALIALDRSRIAGLLSQSAEQGAISTPTPSLPASEAPVESETPQEDEDDDEEGKDVGDDETTGKSPQPSESASGGGSNGTLIQGADALRPGEALNFSAGGTAAVLLNDGGTYRAFSRACTHQFTNVDWQPANGSFYCSNHGARFSATGESIVGPARTPLRPITVSVGADGSVSYTR